eukprot:2516884-Pleurochrysis_carterae.AAC.5
MSAAIGSWQLLAHSSSHEFRRSNVDDVRSYAGANVIASAFADLGFDVDVGQSANEALAHTHACSADAGARTHVGTGAAASVRPNVARPNLTLGVNATGTALCVLPHRSTLCDPGRSRHAGERRALSYGGVSYAAARIREELAVVAALAVVGRRVPFPISRSLDACH